MRDYKNRFNERRQFEHSFSSDLAALGLMVAAWLMAIGIALFFVI